MRKKGKRLISLALILTMILTLLPQSAINSKAASKTALNGLANKDIGLESSGSANWEVGESTVTGSVAGKKIFTYRSQNGTITFTNKKATKATLSFHYTLEQNGGTVQVPKGTAVTTEGDYSVELDAGATVECYIESAKSANVTKLILTEIRLVSDTTATTTFGKAEHGSYTVDGTAVTDTYTKTQSSTVPYELEATADAGYKFVGWYDETNGKYLSSEKKASLNIEQDITIVPKFIDEKVAGFSVESQKFFDLNEAIEYAKKNNIEKITLCESGSISGNYTIPEGITLLIPFDSAETLYTTTPGYTTETPAQKAYKTLTLESGSTINVEGAISVGGKHYTSSTQYCCRTIGEYGQIKMLAGSSINLKQGSNLYAWGYITGEGTLQANSGSNVYEYFQIADWRGGNATISAIGTHKSSKIFPFSQYYVQNIENAITFEAGANEYAYASVTASITGTQSATVPFIGESGLFTLAEGSTITKKYNPQTDRMTFTVNGDAAVNSIAMKVGSMNVNSADFVLPINNNIDLKVDKGTLTANKDIALLPGVTVSVAEDACLQVASGAAVYVYDMDQWNSGYIYTSSGNYAPVAYTPSGRGSRSLADVKIDVNGKLIVAGELYTTESGADICSSKNTGVYVQEGTPGTATATHQFTQSGSTLTVNDIPITPAKLHNADGSYTETKDAKAGDSYTVSEEGKWVKVKRLYTVTWVDEDGTELEKDENVEEGTVPEYNGKTPTKDGDAQYSYTFKGWTPEVSEVTDNITYKATYEQTVNKYKVTWKNADGTELATDEVAYGEVPEYKGNTPEKDADEKHTYEFIGWTPDVKEVIGDVEYTAVFKENIKTYTATWVDEDGKQLQKTTDIPCGETREYTGKEPTKAGDAQYSYKFKGWSQSVDEKTGDITYTATYEQTVNKYKISWVNDNGDELATEEVAYGETPVYSGTTPTKEATDEYSYTFKGWTPEVSKVTKNATYTATYDSVKNN